MRSGMQVTETREEEEKRRTGLGLGLGLGFGAEEEGHDLKITNSVCLSVAELPLAFIALRRGHRREGRKG